MTSLIVVSGIIIRLDKVWYSEEDKKRYDCETVSYSLFYCITLSVRLLERATIGIYEYLTPNEITTALV